MEILTGKTAGTMNKNGTYPTNSINGIVAERLLDFFKKAQQINQMKKQ
jgi:hypothetical protein